MDTHPRLRPLLVALGLAAALVLLPGAAAAQDRKSVV